jgi:hypothetical protein
VTLATVTLSGSSQLPEPVSGVFSRQAAPEPDPTQCTKLASVGHGPLAPVKDGGAFARAASATQQVEVFYLLPPLLNAGPGRGGVESLIAEGPRGAVHRASTAPAV